jgi:hypothetical protein
VPDLSNPTVRRLVALVISAGAVGLVRRAFALEFELHPLAGVLVAVVLSEIVQPALTNDLIQRGI